MESQMQFASATTTQSDPEDATRELAREILGQVNAPDFAMLFLSPHFAPAAVSIADQLRAALSPRVLIGCTCEGVIGRDRESEDEPRGLFLRRRDRSGRRKKFFARAHCEHGAVQAGVKTG